jgi:acyl carrier protein
MSWKDRLKRSFVGDAQDASPAGAVLLEPAATSAADPEVLNDLRKRIVALSEGKLRAEEIDAQGNIFDYGYVDSLSVVSFLAQIEDDYGTRIPDLELIDRLSTLDAIAAHISAAR